MNAITISGLNPIIIITFLQALGVDAVFGMLIMLGIAMLLGIVILIGEHIVYRRFLPYMRSQPKGTLWRSPNLMFFSQVKCLFTAFITLKTYSIISTWLAKNVSRKSAMCVNRKWVQSDDKHSI